MRWPPPPARAPSVAFVASGCHLRLGANPSVATDPGLVTKPPQDLPVTPCIQYPRFAPFKQPHLRSWRIHSILIYSPISPPGTDSPLKKVPKNARRPLRKSSILQLVPRSRNRHSSQSSNTPRLNHLRVDCSVANSFVHSRRQR